jgi:hypothetical protein
MNYFAHGYAFLQRPYFVAGTALPDWLSVVDRKVRVKSKHAAELLDHSDARLAALAAGIMQHYRDDAWFHSTRAFAELSWQLTVAVRELMPEDDGLRPSFLGHILVEILLDAALIERGPQQLDAYYTALAQVDPGLVRDGVQQMTARPVALLGAFIPAFCAERFLYDYQDDAKLLSRLNRIMGRVGLRPLPEAFRAMLPQARQQVRERRDDLLAGAESD